MTMRSSWSAVIVAGVLLAPAAASAQGMEAGAGWPEPSPSPEARPPIVLPPLPQPAGGDAGYDEPRPEKPKRYVQRHLGLEIGARTAVVLFEGFDPYSRSDLLPSFALAATWTPVRVGAFRLALRGEYDIGGQSATARGDETSLVVHRFAGGLEAGLLLGPRVRMFAKAAPALLHLRASIDDPAIDRPLVARTFTWGLDATGGTAVMLAAVGDREWPAARFWLTGELGYAFAGEAAMRFTPEEDEDDPRRFGEVELPGLRPSGVVSRIALAITF